MQPGRSSTARQVMSFFIIKKQCGESGRRARGKLAVGRLMA
jgi:hypothetical protein